MLFKTLHIAVCFTLLAAKVTAQISPGELTKAHAHLEGVFNCTKCHVLGDKVSNDKCLDCHKEIKTRLDRGAGYHATREVKGKDCFACHSDHHGRNFDIVRFDKNKFNHNLTGFELTGAHKTIDCRQCHKPDFVEDPGLKKRSKSYLGLHKECNACHEDYHQKTLSNDCAKCHTTAAFSPASKFDHNKARYALAGKHKTVDCAACHKEETRAGKPFQQFTGIAFNNCNSCHKDPHDFNLGSNCKQCHTEESFNALTGLKKFNHGETHFPLKGKHRQADCAGCHNMDATPATIFQDRFGVRTNDCAGCHKDPHESKFGTVCADCHNEDSFRASGSMKNFNHDRTGFELAGKHKTVDCRKCHTTGNYTTPLKHYTCDACHQDYHEGQLASILGLSPDCAKCHTVEGFKGSLFTIADHAKTGFPLDGAHLATPCFACHQKDTAKKWQFRNIGKKCADCHDDVHKGFLDQKFYPDQTCERCHVTAAWSDNHFDHNQTKFRLSGAHANQPCMACHGKKDDTGKLPQRYQKFADLSTTCTACHKNVHGRQFEKNGATDCAQCHGFNNWDAVKFNHNKTAFKLDGKHATVACSGCHKETVVDGEVMVQYKMKSFKCIDCHL